MVTKQKKKLKKQVPFRLNMLFVAVFLLFSTLILRLGIIQIVEGEEYVRKAEEVENVTARIDAPRGKIVDRYGNTLVDNEPIYTITYTATNTTRNAEKLHIAERLASIIEKDTNEITERDMKDYWIITRLSEAKKKLTEEEWLSLEDNEAYNLQLKRITKGDIASISKTEMEILAIKREMDSGFALTPTPIKEGVSKIEHALVIEHLSQLPGIEIQLDARRTYPYGDTLKELFGSIKKIPKEEIDYYEVRGYDRNDKVGTSGIEQQYEELLRGKKEQQKYITDKSGQPIGSPEIIAGERGKDLVLTIDIALQQRFEEILEREILKGRNISGNNDFNSAYVVMAEPKTGEILAIAGKQYKEGKFSDAPLTNIYNAFEMGSTVKGATVLTGLQEGVIKQGTVLYDAPLQFGDSTISSYKTLGSINDVTALEKSSNVYMFKIAMMLSDYNYDRKCCVNDDKVQETFQTMRNYYQQFGLGIKTGIDFPYEASGYNGGSGELYQSLFFAIGQFDTYTPLQLTQYISTIANDGYRVQPRFLKSIHEPVVEENKNTYVINKLEPIVLNKIDMKQEYIDRVQLGFRSVMTVGTASPHFSSASYKPAGKTGTAEINKEKGINNQTLVGYAPYKDPEIAFSVVVPTIKNGSINLNIGRAILDEYFSLKKERKAY
jgi:penicillin-binding protein A